MLLLFLPENWWATDETTQAPCWEQSMLKLDQGQPPGWEHMELNYSWF